MTPASENPPQEELTDKLHCNEKQDVEGTQNAAVGTPQKQSTKKPNPRAAAFTPRGATFSETLEDLYGFSIEYASADESSRFV